MVTTPAPPIPPLDLVIHIGMGETQATSIQTFLAKNRERLADLGHVYPLAPGPVRHARLSRYIQPNRELTSLPAWDGQAFSTPAEFRQTFRQRLFREINRSGRSRVLLSDEALFGATRIAQTRLSRFVDRTSTSVKLVVYLRRQDDHLIDRYQRVVMRGETRRLVERAQEVDVSSTYDYHARLRRWDQVLEPTEFVVRRFDRNIARRSLYQSFLDAVGIDARAGDLEQVRLPDESLDAETIELLRILNVYRQEFDGECPLPANRALIPRLIQDSRGRPGLAAPRPFLDEFMARWEDSNRRVAREFLADQRAPLFRARHVVDDETVTEQRLDPHRLDHYLELLDLPGKAHVSLRRLAIREADR